MWIKFEGTPKGREIKPVEDISLSKSQLYISRKVYEQMKQPRYLFIYIDKELQAIKLQKVEAPPKDIYYLPMNPWKVSTNNRAFLVVSKKLYKEMPIGRYNRVKAKGFIFKYTNI